MKLTRLMENKVIIIGINHESTLGFVRCFGIAGIFPICVLYGPKEGLVFSSKYAKEAHHEDNQEACLEYIIKNFSAITPKPFLFGSNDESASVINENYNFLKEHFIVESAKDCEGEIVRLMDKWTLYQEAEQHGLKVAKTLLMNRNDKIPSGIEYPVFTKSMRTIDGGKSDEKICKDEEELRRYIKLCHAEMIMVQKYIEKKEEFNYYGFSCGGEVFIPYENHRPRFAEGKLSGYHIFQPAEQNDLYRSVISLMRETGYNGLFTAEFLIDKSGDAFFMEVNFRHDGATWLLVPGLNIPIEYCLRVLGEKSGSIHINKKKVIGMRERVDYEQSVKSGKMPFIKWFNELLTVDSRMLIDRHDMGPLWFSIKNRIKNRH